MTLFSSSYFRDEGQLRTYFDKRKEETLSEITGAITSKAIRNEAQWRGYEIVLLGIASPLVVIFSFSVFLSSLFLSCMGATNLASRSWAYGERIWRNLALISQVASLGEKLLVPTFNGRNHLAYLESTIPLDECPKSIQKIAKEKKSEISFHNHYFCQAMCLWFHYLFETEKQSAVNERLLAIAIANLFTSGSDDVATVMQSCNFAKEEWLGVHLKPEKKWTVEELFQKNSSFTERIEKAPPGSYELLLKSSSRHTINFIKTNEGAFLVFDPDVGLIDYTEEGPTALFKRMHRFFTLSSTNNDFALLFSAKILKT